MRNGMGWVFCLMSFVGACVSHSQVDRADAGVVEPAPPEAGSCDTVVLTSRDDYEAARDCIRIDGDLLVSADSSVDRLEFPRLIEITGKISPVYVELPHLLRTLRFPVLQNVGGSVELSATRAAKVAWPELRTIGGNLMVDVSPELVSFAAPKLEHVGGTVEFASDLELKRLDLRSLNAVGGDLVIIEDYRLDELKLESIASVAGAVQLDGLYRLNRDELTPIWNAGDKSRPIGEIDCCEAESCANVDPVRCE